MPPLVTLVWQMFYPACSQLPVLLKPQSCGEYLLCLYCRFCVWCWTCRRGLDWHTHVVQFLGTYWWHWDVWWMPHERSLSESTTFSQGVHPNCWNLWWVRCLIFAVEGLRWQWVTFLCMGFQQGFALPVTPQDKGIQFQVSLLTGVVPHIGHCWWGLLGNQVFWM